MDGKMKIPCLSLWQPWASICFEHDGEGHPIKVDETRHWPTRVSGLVALHAAKTKVGMEDIWEDELNPYGLSYQTMPYGAILGVVRITACHRTEDIRSRRTDSQLYWGNYGPGRFAFEMGVRHKFDEPIPYRGQQGFFSVEIPDQLVPRGLR